jgi:outer membrane receptor for ferrienterochelin and colicins
MLAASTHPGAIKTMKCCSVHAMAAVLLSPWLPALAQVASSTTVETTDLQQVQVRARRHDVRRDEVASRIVINKEQLTGHGDDTLAEAIKRLPGVTVEAAEPGTGGSIVLRGMGQGYTQILIDGQPVPTGFDAGSLSADRIERIEIVRTATADMRAEAIAGSINIVAQAADRLTPAVNWSHAHRGDGFAATTHAAVSRRSFMVEERGVERGADEAGNADLLRTTALQVHGERSALSLSPNLHWDLGEDDQLDWRLQLDASRLRKRADIDWDTAYGEPLQHASYRQHTDNRAWLLRSDLQWQQHFANDAVLDSTLTLTADRSRTRFHEIGFAEAGQQNLDDITRGQTDADIIATQGKYSFAMAEQHALQLGWDITHERRDESRRQRLLGFAGEQDRYSDLNYVADIDRMALFVQDEWRLSGRWSLYWGARWERLRTRSEGDDFSAIRQRSSVFSPSVQARWKLRANRDDQLRVGLSRTFRAPTLQQLIPRPYTSTNNRQLDPDQMGNPRLRPELATGLDVALERFWAEGKMLSIGAYARRIEDVILTRTRLIEQRWVAQPINAGLAYAHGLELDGKWSLPHALDVRFNLTRNWSRLRSVAGSANRIEGQPRLSSTFALDQRLQAGWQWGLSYSYRSGDGSRSSAEQLSWQSARRELDVHLSRRLSAGSRLRWSATNLLGQNRRNGSLYMDQQQYQKLVRERRTPIGVRLDWEMTY